MKLNLKRKRIKFFMPAVMSDISFLLLIFFILSGSMGQSFDIKQVLPEINNIMNLDTSNIKVIHIDDKGNFYLNYRLITPVEIYKYLQKYNFSKSTIFEIRADKDIEYEKIEAIFLILQAFGYNRINLILEKEIKNENK